MDSETYTGWARDIIRSVQPAWTIVVACFCEDSGVSLTQWRGYGNAGYAIGFKAKSLASQSSAGFPERTQVAYGSASGRALFAGNILEPLIDAVFAAPATTLVQTLGMPRVRPNRPVGLAAQMKDVAFKDEREWRIGVKTASSETNLKFRTSEFGITPYIEVPLPSTRTLLPIEHICVALGPELDLRVSAVQTLMRRHCYQVGSAKNEVRVTSSNIPFRG